MTEFIVLTSLKDEKLQPRFTEASNLRMYILLILAAITAINLGKAFGTEKSITGKSEYALAVDVRVSVPSSAFSCMKKYGYKTVFVRGYDPTGDGKFDSNAVDNIHNANKAGLGTEVFMTPQPRSDKKGSQQLVELYEGLKNGDIKVKTIWVQVTSPVNWFPDTKINIDFLNDILSAAAHYEVKIGLYTNGYDWSQITNNAAADKIMLWYWNVMGGGPNGETPADFDDFRPFAKFTKPTVKQFAQVETVCEIKVNRDVYMLSQSQSVASAPGDSKGEVVVGSLGDGLVPKLMKIV